MRTIGDPDIRFREDPIRILRAVKFAARCDLTIEPETYRRMMEHREEIAKCAQARVSEEFYRLLRGGAAKRSMELLLETELLDIMAPEIARGLKGEPDDEDAALRRARLWGYLAAADRSTARRPVAPSNALLLAVLVLPPLRDALDPDSNGVRDIGQLVAQSIAPALDRLRPSRRDSELARQILLALRYILPSKRPRRRPRLSHRDFFDDALRLAEIVSDAEGVDATLAGRPDHRRGHRRPMAPRRHRRRWTTRCPRPSSSRWTPIAGTAAGATAAGAAAAAASAGRDGRPPQHHRPSPAQADAGDRPRLAGQRGPHADHTRPAPRLPGQRRLRRPLGQPPGLAAALSRARRTIGPADWSRLRERARARERGP